MAEKAISKIKNKKYGYKCDQCNVVGKTVIQTAKRMLCPDCAVKEDVASKEDIEAMELEE